MTFGWITIRKNVVRHYALASCVTDILTDNFLSFNWWINRLLADFFFKNKRIAKIIFKIFSVFFSKTNRISTEFFFKYKKIAKIIFKIFSKFFFFRKFFSTNFFLWKFLLSNFFWRTFFFSQKYFCENFFHNIFANFFCIWCLQNNVFCEIFYSKFCLLRIFLFCNFGVQKKKCEFFFCIFSAIFDFREREYQIWKFFFPEKK